MILQASFLSVDTPLSGDERKQAERIICEHHYLHSVPSGKTYLFRYESALICYSIPANPFIASYLLWPGATVWELSRLYAPDGHRPNLLTQAISTSLSWLRQQENIDCVVSYADPNVGHHGGVYRAASWIYLGVTEETRTYIDGKGQIYPRRKFHSNGHSLTKSEIISLGFRELNRQGKHRFARGFSKKVRKALRKRTREDALCA